MDNRNAQEAITESGRHDQGYRGSFFFLSPRLREIFFGGRLKRGSRYFRLVEVGGWRGAWSIGSDKINE